MLIIVKAIFVDIIKCEEGKKSLTIQIIKALELIHFLINAEVITF